MSSAPKSSTCDRTYEQLCDHAREAELLASVQNVLEWDERTKLPPAGGEYRAEQVTYLAGLIHQKQTAPEIGQWLAELLESPLAADPHGETGAVIHRMHRDYEKKVRLPQALVQELARTAVLGQRVWSEARRADDFARFRPVLEKTIALKRREAEAVGYTDALYDALLDDYEPGERTADVARVLAELRAQLVPLVERITGSGHTPQREILTRRYPVDVQDAFGKRIAAEMGFDFDAGRLDVTDHPFCTTLGPHDTRLTTRYDEHDFSDGLFSILHEAGHGIYEQGLPAEYVGLPTGKAVSLGIHESQSRLWENLVGRNFSFWEHFYPAAQGAFPAALGNVALEDFYFAVNDVRPSLIRTDADELTYDLHILVRFELEMALLSGDLAVDELPGAWNEKYRRYLGVVPSNNADGVLQDVHWSAGLFGYFPTYSLGNLYAAQFFAQAGKELGDLDDQFRQGNFAPLRGWMWTHIYQYGRRFSPAELIQRATGRPLSHDDLVQRLRTKFETLYRLA